MEKFSTTLHGYNPEEVNEFLDDVIKKVELMIKSNEDKNTEIDCLKKELEKAKTSAVVLEKAKKYDELGETLNKAIILAKDTGEHIRRVAKQERELMLEEAKKNADDIVKDAIKKSEKIEYQASVLRRNIILFKRRLKNNLEEQQRLIEEIEILDENM